MQIIILIKFNPIKTKNNVTNRIIGHRFRRKQYFCIKWSEGTKRGTGTSRVGQTLEELQWIRIIDRFVR